MQVEQKEFYKALQLVSKSVDKQSSLHLLHHCLVVFDGDSGYLHTTDLEKKLCAPFAATGAPFIAALPCIDLKNMVKPAKGQKQGVIDITRNGVKVDITVNGIKGTLDLFPDDDIDVLFTRVTEEKPAGKWLSIELLHILDYIVPAVSSDETRLSINCILFKENKIVGTDGHRMHVFTAPNSVDKQFLIPQTGIKVLIGYLKAVGKDAIVFVRLFNENDICITNNKTNHILNLKQPEVEFPPYEQAIASYDFSNIVTLKNPKEAQKILKQFYGKDTYSIKVTLKDSYLEIEQTTDGNTKTGRIACEISKTEKDGYIGLNAGYLNEAIPNHVSEVTLSWDNFKNKNTYLLFVTTDQILAVVRPMRI